jgi:hypothetical protein
MRKSQNDVPRVLDRPTGQPALTTMTWVVAFASTLSSLLPAFCSLSLARHGRRHVDPKPKPKLDLSLIPNCLSLPSWDIKQGLQAEQAPNHSYGVTQSTDQWMFIVHHGSLGLGKGKQKIALVWGTNRRGAPTFIMVDMDRDNGYARSAIASCPESAHHLYRSLQIPAATYRSLHIHIPTYR